MFAMISSHNFEGRGGSALIYSIVKNIEFREDQPQEQWTRLFTEDADSCCELKSVTNIIDTRKTQCYFILPKGGWKDLTIIGQRGEDAVAKLSSTSRIIKFGFCGYETGRHDGHTREYGGVSRILDSILTQVATAAELKFKDWLRNEGRLLSGMHQYKSTNDTELLEVNSQEEYEYLVSVWQGIIRELEDSVTPMEVELERQKTKQAEEITKQKQLELEISKIQLQLKTM